MQLQQALLCCLVVQDGDPFQVHAPFGEVGEFPQGTAFCRLKPKARNPSAACTVEFLDFAYGAIQATLLSLSLAFAGIDP